MDSDSPSKMKALGSWRPRRNIPDLTNTPGNEHEDDDDDDDDDLDGDDEDLDVGVDFVTELKESMNELKKLWDELDVGVEEKVAFYSELDLVSPYNKRVHEMYEDVLKELQQGGA